MDVRFRGAPLDDAAAATAAAGPIKRCLHACWWTSDGRLALYGGQTNGVPALGDLWFLTPGADDAAAAWAEAPGQKAPARQLAAVARRGELTIIFGGRGDDGEVLADAWVVPDGDDRPRAAHGRGVAAGALGRGDGLRRGGRPADPVRRRRRTDAFGDAWELTFP